MTYTVRLTPQAEADLDRALDWYFQKDPAVAVEWYRGFQQAIMNLSANPHQHGLSRENDLFADELRDLLYGSGRKKTHRAVFRIVEDCVEVVAVRHHAQRDITPDDIESA
jgi:plasmid stabilization system protein ParE